ncbi:putative lipase/esterase [Streptomyces spiroverticillatus]|uniref:Lipase/esterase n=1 Tax=Streptomyces finlayi TaxID=67296 RepID=A0A918X4P7_9ACTN|nr:alpha/beta hydrolase [Streptomyces finlayi]GHA29687.1 putative lipase/esterase [Streptomyces spiroverticillatus]GHD10025.1 putative lipase/esterase [Streptomyces finlayi]
MTHAGHDRLDPVARPLVDRMSACFPDLGRTVTSAVQARRVLAAQPPGPGGPPVGSVEDRTIPGPAGAPDIPVRVYLPDRPAPYPTVVYFHGGGFALCGLDSHDATVRQLCAGSGAAFVSVDYRLAPEAPFPAAVDDAYTALVWVAEHIKEVGGDPGALVVAGDSAGGCLAAVCAQSARACGGPALALQVLLYPVLDAAQDTVSYRRNAGGYFHTAAHMRWYWEQYLGREARALARDPRVSPLRAADLRGLPPAYVLTAGCDPLCDEGEAYVVALRAAGVTVERAHFPAMFHGFLGFTGLLADSRAAMAGVTGAIAATGACDRKNSGDLGGRAG